MLRSLLSAAMNLPARHPRLLPMLLATGFACLLYAGRVWMSGSTKFSFLLWNLFLAWIPWLISAWLVRRPRPLLLLVPALAAWLLFFPNAPYILTDLVHFRKYNRVPQWYDLSLILAFAWAGLLAGLNSLEHIHGLLRSRWGSRPAWLAAAVLLLLAAYGVYLGRYGRRNSWEVLTEPESLLGEAAAPLLDPQTHLSALGFSVVFGLLLFTLYAAWHRREPA
ncbi:MAG: DUF1361 domain-containing protein [Bacteroidia bacterium]|nr:DUF1361 domain-containing protein [Bacteroidia bacterium]